MKKNILIGIIGIGVIASGILLFNKLYTYLIIVLTVTVLAVLYLMKILKEKQTPESIYEQNLNEIIKTYEPILVDVKTTPEFDVKNIITVSSFEKLADVQYELKKPILYRKNISSCAFILMDNEVAYVYILRMNENSFSPIDDIIKSIEISAKKRRKDKKTLEDIDKTTIIKLDDSKEYKVSPVRKINLEKTNKIEIIKEPETKEVTKEQEEIEVL